MGIVRCAILLVGGGGGRGHCGPAQGDALGSPGPLRGQNCGLGAGHLMVVAVENQDVRARLGPELLVNGERASVVARGATR